MQRRNVAKVFKTADWMDKNCCCCSDNLGQVPKLCSGTQLSKCRLIYRIFFVFFSFFEICVYINWCLLLFNMFIRSSNAVCISCFNAKKCCDECSHFAPATGADEQMATSALVVQSLVPRTAPCQYDADTAPKSAVGKPIELVDLIVNTTPALAAPPSRSLSVDGFNEPTAGIVDKDRNETAVYVVQSLLPLTAPCQYDADTAPKSAVGKPIELVDLIVNTTPALAAPPSRSETVDGFSEAAVDTAPRSAVEKPIEAHGHLAAPIVGRRTTIMTAGMPPSSHKEQVFLAMKTMCLCCQTEK